MTGIPGIERLQAIRLEPGDLVIVTVPAGVTVDQFDEIAAAVKDELPDSVRVLVVSDTVGIAAYRPIATEPTPGPASPLQPGQWTECMIEHTPPTLRQRWRDRRRATARRLTTSAANHQDTP